MSRVALLSCAALALAACSSASNAESPSGSGTDSGTDAGGGGIDARADSDAPDASTHGDSSAGSDAATPLVWSACDTTGWPSGYPTAPSTLQCTTISVPVDRSQPGGPMFKLRVGRAKSTAFPTGKAVFALAGGPGGSAVWESGVIPQVYPALLDTFDIVYVDQRGTGDSDYLDCSNGYPVTQQDWTTCAAEHTTEPLDHYLTADAAEDIESVRLQLGYSKAYLRGGSYGTRVGLEYARRYPQNLAAAVLDGVLPPDVDIYSQEMTAPDTDVADIIADCNASAACLAVSPTLEADLASRKQTLAAHPRAISIGGQAYTEDDQFFEESLYGALDWTTTYYEVPRAIHASVGGDNTLWNGILSNVYGVTVTGMSDPSHRGEIISPVRLHPPRNRSWKGCVVMPCSYVAPALFETVTCAEYLPNTSMPNLQTLSAAQSWTYSADGVDLVGQAQACSSWKVSPAGASERQAVTSPAHVLLMSGAIDDRTPAAWGAQAIKTLPNGKHVVVPYASHEAGTVFPCAATMTIQYLVNDGDYSKVDSSCIQSITQPAW